MTAHVGTHIDALGHFSKGDRLYNGLSAAETVTDWGLVKLGIEQAPPMITRGVLLDVAGLDGGPHLNPGRSITPDDLARAADAAKVAIEPGDIVLIRTGWGRYFGMDNPRYLAGEPGIDVPAARWLTAAGRGGDRLRQHGGRGAAQSRQTLSMPVHQHALAEAGVYLIENLVLDELARDRLTQLLLHPAGDEVPRRDGQSGAAGGAGIASKAKGRCPLKPPPRAKPLAGCQGAAPLGNNVRRPA